MKAMIFVMAMMMTKAIVDDSDDFGDNDDISKAFDVDDDGGDDFSDDGDDLGDDD